MTVSTVLHEQRETIARIAGRHGVTRLRVFGSVARGEDTPESDIDLLIETGAETSAWFPAGFILDLEQLLGRRVEVVTERALRPSCVSGCSRKLAPYERRHRLSAPYSGVHSAH